MTPFVTYAPMLVHQKLMGEIVVSWLLIIFWILPVAIAINKKTNNAPRIYAGYMFAYYGAIWTILLYHGIKFGIPKWLLSLMQTPDWILNVIFEIIALFHYYGILNQRTTSRKAKEFELNCVYKY